MVSIFSKPVPQDQTSSKLAELQSKIDQQNIAIADLLAKKQDASNNFETALEDLGLLESELQKLKQQAAAEAQEAQLAESLRQLRPVADRINSLSQQLFEALGELEKLSVAVPSKHQRDVVNAYSRHELPVCLHKEGLTCFKLLPRSKARNEPESLKRGIL